MADVIAEYNPNIKWGKQHVEVVLKQWGYERTFIEKVGGNCHGVDVLTCAISNLADRLYDAAVEGEPFTIGLTNPTTGRTLLCQNEDGISDEDWISRMCVSLRVVGYDPPTLNQVRELNGAAPVLDGDRPYRFD